MAILKCKMCGGDLLLQPGSTVAECQYCGTMQTIPTADDDKKISLFNRANRLRFGCEFDKASGVYEAIVADFPEEAEAYWGLVLCRFGIEYVDDPGTGKKIPTCHRTAFDSVMDDSNFEQVLENSDTVARRLYREEAKAIEELRKGIIEVSSKEDPYDVFICYKETAEDGQRTVDSVLAQDVYTALTEKGYRVFFSRITLEDKLGQEYEPYIFAALNSAKVMLVFGTDYEYFNAVWVRNEWSRFLELIAKGEKKTLIPCYKGIDAYDMPKEFAKLQAQDLGKVGAVQDLLRGIDKLIEPGTISSGSETGIDVAELLGRGNEALQRKDWEVASSRFDLALIADGDCADAYLGKLMAENKVNKPNDLAKARKRLKKSGNFREAVRCADEALKQELEGYERASARRCAVKRIVAGMLVGVVAAVGLFFGGLFVVDGIYEDTVSGFMNGTKSPQEAYDTFERLAWYKEDEGLMYLAAVGMGTPSKAEGLYPGKLVLTEATAGYLANRMERFDISGIESIEFISGGEWLPEMRLNQLSALQEIVIPEGVTQIPDELFKGHRVLKRVTFPSTLRKIGNSAFEGCTALNQVQIPGTVDMIGDKCFLGCSSLEQLTIGQGVVSIGHEAFRNSGLTSIKIPGSVTDIGSEAFSNCKELKIVEIGNGVTTIWAGAFSDCISLQSVRIPGSVENISNFAFFNCVSLREVVLEPGVQMIGASAFKKCTVLEKVTLGDGLSRIDSDAFRYCESLKEVFVPMSVTSMGSNVFDSTINQVRCARSVRPSGWANNWIASSSNVVWNADD